ASLFNSLHATEERVERSVETSEHVLQDLGMDVAVFRSPDFDGGELGALLTLHGGSSPMDAQTTPMATHHVRACRARPAPQRRCPQRRASSARQPLRLTRGAPPTHGRPGFDPQERLPVQPLTRSAVVKGQGASGAVLAYWRDNGHRRGGRGYSHTRPPTAV